VKWTPSGPLIASQDGLRRGDANATVVDAQIGRLFAIVVSRDRQNVAALGRGKLLWSRDGGRTFGVYLLPDNHNYFAGAFVQSDLLVFSVGGHAYRVTPSTITAIPLPKTATWWGASFADDQRGYLVGTCNNVLTTDDGGRTWLELPTSLKDAQGVLAQGSRVWIGAEGGLFLSEDRGHTFRTLIEATHCHRMGAAGDGIAIGCFARGQTESRSVWYARDGLTFQPLKFFALGNVLSADVSPDQSVLAVETEGALLTQSGDALNVIHESNEAHRSRAGLREWKREHIAELKGIALDESRKPLANFELNVIVLRGGRPEPTTTDQNGAFVLKNVMRGEGYFFAHQGYVEFEAKKVDIPLPSSGEIVFTRLKPLEILVTAAGRPVPYAVIGYNSLPRSLSFMRAGADGRAVLPRPRRALGRVFANDAGENQNEALYSTRSDRHHYQWTSLDSAAASDSVVIELEEGLTFSVLVTDDLGQPLGNQRVDFFQQEDQRQLTTSPEGVLKLEHLQDSGFRLFPYYGNWRQFGDQVDLDPQRMPDKVVFDRHVEVTGSVHLDGKPLPSFSIEAKKFNAPDGSFQTLHTAHRQLCIAYKSDPGTAFGCFDVNGRPGEKVDLGVLELKRPEKSTRPGKTP
jgi:hypothetical protein